MEVKVCPSCGRFNKWSTIYCENSACKRILSIDTMTVVNDAEVRAQLGDATAAEIASQQAIAETARRPSNAHPDPVYADSGFLENRVTLGLDGRMPIGVLRVLAWFNLVAGIILALFMFSQASTRDLGALFVTLGFVFAAEGLIGWALLLVVCIVAENVVVARRAIEKQRR